MRGRGLEEFLWPTGTEFGSEGLDPAQLGDLVNDDCTEEEDGEG
jgi:hypothetical protein